jgi:hypothetical protein
MEILNKKEKNIYLSYVPHGVNHNVFKPVEVPVEFKKQVFGDKEYDFVLFWSNRNIRRKQPSDVIYAFKQFCDHIGPEKTKDVVLLMHTQPIDENGTDLPRVSKDIAPDCNIIFSDNKLAAEELNYLYNLADLTINLADAEGFGLSTAESVMAGTPIMVNVTGGLQDQCGFKINGEYITPQKYIELQTLSGGNMELDLQWIYELEYGKWAFPVFSPSHNVVGSVPTPYIYEDRVSVKNVADWLIYVYELGREELKNLGLEGREAFINDLGFTADNMCTQMIESIEHTISNWKPRQPFELYKL